QRARVRGGARRCREARRARRHLLRRDVRGHRSLQSSNTIPNGVRNRSPAPPVRQPATCHDPERMPATRVQRAARKEALVRAAIEVMVEHGLAESRIADIAARAGISPGHVLYYFESKDDLFLQALGTVERDLRDDVLARTATLTTGAERFGRLLEAAAPTG